MPVAYLLEWMGVTYAQYRQVVQELGWEDKLIQESLVHTTSADGSKLLVVEVWESHEAFDEFLAKKLKPVLEKIGLHLPSVLSWLIPAETTPPAFPPKQVRWSQPDQPLPPSDFGFALGAARINPLGFSIS